MSKRETLGHEDGNEGGFEDMTISLPHRHVPQARGGVSEIRHLVKNDPEKLNSITSCYNRTATLNFWQFAQLWRKGRVDVFCDVCNAELGVTREDFSMKRKGN